MPDDKTKTRPQDSDRVNVNEDYEVQYWSEKFGVSADELRSAVQKAGPMIADLEAHFSGPGGGESLKAAQNAGSNR